MEIAKAAQVLAKQATKIRTRTREVNCRCCGKSFSARSAKAQYCSKSCLNRVWYSKDKDELYVSLGQIQVAIKALMGKDPRIDPTLKRIFQLLFKARMDHTVKMGKLPLEAS